MSPTLKRAKLEVEHESVSVELAKSPLTLSKKLDSPTPLTKKLASSTFLMDIPLTKESEGVEPTSIATSGRDAICRIKAEFRIEAPQLTQENRESLKADRKDRKRGQNKKRERTGIVASNEPRLCHAVALGKECDKSDCKFSHDLVGYLESKEPDIGHVCPVFEAYGQCKYGIRCRFSTAHTLNGVQNIRSNPIEIGDVVENMEATQIPKHLRQGTLDMSRSIAFKTWFDAKTLDNTTRTEDVLDNEPTLTRERTERKTLDFTGKTYLAPLTTVGNLPFRRICKGFGVDITCGEMALASSLIQGQSNEWSLLRRHKSEDIFGIQLTGNHPSAMATVLDAIQQSARVDFVDLNMGCPVEAITKFGAGSALMERKSRLRGMLQAFDYILDTPFTVKFRTGIMTKTNTAHKLFPLFEANSVSLLTLHGRSKEQRYTKLADWDYIDECSKTTKIPFFGNGDIFSPQEYFEKLQIHKSLSGVMIGRAGLIKPWIFKEIQNNQLYDISSTERLDILKNFATNGLEYWGSDTMGVNTTRRFMCDWLSFLYRYVPVGLLEVLPQKLNERPESFKGRNELETLMASDNCQDWIKLTELVLGPAPESFKFIPKHKSNSYEAQG